MKPSLATLTLAATALTAAIGLGSAANAAGGFQAGMLTCNLEDSSNVIVYSKAKYDCTFTSGKEGAAEQHYQGEIKRYGANLEWKANETLVWAVFAKTAVANNPSLAGNYVGAGADAALGIGVGAKVLVGGLDNSFSLQPLSASGSAGIGASLGVDHFELTQ